MIDEHKIKKYSGEYDEEIIVRLKLERMSIKTISNLECCTALKYLSLSHNQITSITGLESLENLVRVDLSFNQITKINSNSFTENTNIEYLNLIGNKISDVNDIKNLECLENLDSVLFKDENGKNANPICSHEFYFDMIQKTLKSVNVLDGGAILLMDYVVDMKDRIAAFQPPEEVMNTPRVTNWIQESDENHPIFNVDSDNLDNNDDGTNMPASHIKDLEDAEEAVKTVLTFDCSHALRKASGILNKSQHVQK